MLIRDAGGLACHVGLLHVRPSWPPGTLSAGIAAPSLAEHILDRARAAGFMAMQFNAVVASNAGAVTLWRSPGFAVLATVPDGVNHPVPGYVGLHIIYGRL
jgi:hypothetical protein